MGKNTNVDPRWASIEKTITRLDHAAIFFVCLTAGAILAAIGEVLLEDYVAVWGFVKWAFLFYLGNVVFDSAASALEFWENNEKAKAQKAAFDAALGEHRAAPVSGADAVRAFVNDKN